MHLRRSTFLKAAALAVVAPTFVAERVAAADGKVAARDAWPQAAHDLSATRADADGAARPGGALAPAHRRRAHRPAGRGRRPRGRGVPRG